MSKSGVGILRVYIQKASSWIININSILLTYPSSVCWKRDFHKFICGLINVYYNIFYNLNLQTYLSGI